MTTSTRSRTKIIEVMSLGLVLAALLALLVSMAPANAAVTTSKAYGWGDNYFGTLGNGESGAGKMSNMPAAVKNLTDVKSVKAGGSHALALKENGTVRAWGYNREGELGNGTTEPSNTPYAVYDLDNVKAISAGSSHSLALKENGSVWAWGDNTYGQLGIGSTGGYSHYPERVANLGTGVKSIAAGENFNLALMQDGTVRSWGHNFDGELGNGTDGPGTNRNTPGPVGNLRGVTAIATDSSARHALALKQDGTVMAWGDDSSGQIGDGGLVMDENKPSPVPVKNLSSVKSVATGGYHSLALLSSGKVRSWGHNFDGQLGNGTNGLNTDRSTPGGVIGLDNVRSISGGAFQSFAVLESGRARSWGDNQYGELGNGNTGTDSDVPVGVKNLTTVRNIDGGYGFALATQ